MKLFKWITIIFIIAGTAAGSYFYHYQVYSFYYKLYNSFTGNEKKMITEAERLYENGKYRELEKYLNPLLSVYPENGRLKRLAGLNQIKLGRELEGAELFASSADDGMDEINEGKELGRVIKILYRNSYNMEVVSFYDRGVMHSDPNVSFYYGAALYRTGRFDESYKCLSYARGRGFIGEEIDFYTALCLEKLGDPEKALPYMESAYKQNKRNDEVRSSLVRIYRKLKKFKEAEAILRKKN